MTLAGLSAEPPRFLSPEREETRRYLKIGMLLKINRAPFRTWNLYPRTLRFALPSGRGWGWGDKCIAIP